MNETKTRKDKKTRTGKAFKQTTDVAPDFKLKDAILYAIYSPSVNKNNI